MATLSYNFQADGSEHTLQLVRVAGTNGSPYLFGKASNHKPVEVKEFYVTTTPVTQAFWLHVMGSNPAKDRNLNCPVENVSWKQITEPGGFLDRLNSSEVLESLGQNGMRFRLPSETEWEYAARGGPGWPERFVYSDSNDPDEVAWYGPRWKGRHDLVVRLLGWPLGWRTIGRFMVRRPTRIRDVALKKPNQLGLYDMSGNVWEWCQDVCTDDLSALPVDGRPYLGPGDERRLRGGCHHNWDLHCTVHWRYGIEPGAHDGCIGFRLALS